MSDTPTPDPPKREPKPKPICVVCKKPIEGRVYYQAGQYTHPVHKDHRIRLC